LSQNSPQHLQNLPPTHPPAFDQADHHPHILDHGLIPLGANRLRFQPPGFGSLRQLRERDWRSPSLVEGTLLGLAPGIPVILNAPKRGLLLAMGLPTTKGTAQVVAAAGVAWMSQEKNAAMPAPGQAGSQAGLGSQNRSQQQIILQHQGGCRAPVIPVRPELKLLLDPDCKKPKLSLRMLMKY
jgi:hypothetical protein